VSGNARTKSASALAPAPRAAGMRADLVRRLARVLETAEHALDRLAADGWTDPTDASRSVRPETVVSETARLLLAVSSVRGEPALARRVDELARRLAPHARGARMRSGLCFEPALALDHARAHACLRAMGHADPAFDELLRTATRAQAFAARERAPHRALEQRWVAELCGLEGPAGQPPMRALAAMSALGRPLDLVGANREDLHAFTHALMYLKDGRLAPKALPRPRAEVLRDAEAALVRCLADEDYDLACELLLAWPLTGARFGGWATLAWRTLAAVEDAAGLLPAPGTRLAHLGRLDERHRTDALLASAYRTTYVMGLLCAACLASGCLPPAPVREELPPGHGAGGHWAAIYARLPASEREALGGFVHAVTLHRAVRARDAAAIHAALDAAAAADVADGPHWVQAAELLERLVVHEGAAPARRLRLLRTPSNAGVRSET